ncbi:MAG TPA: hypothetical protein VMM36_15245 [Opitutaceae bacterium]|nr:hypothetical protein [Opitutaceae bacterium]
MSNFFSRLFSPVASPTDGLSQTQRGAIVDLLHFCMCADQELTPAESNAIAGEVAAFDWDPAVDFDSFAARSLEKARAAMATAATRESALASISDQLASTETKTQALALCQELFQADGEFAPAERAVFVEIKRAFGWPE